MGTLYPVYQPSDYLKVYASLVTLHGDNVIECVLRSLTFDALDGVAYLEHQLDSTLSGFIIGDM